MRSIRIAHGANEKCFTESYFLMIVASPCMLFMIESLTTKFLAPLKNDAGSGPGTLMDGSADPRGEGDVVWAASTLFSCFELFFCERFLRRCMGKGRERDENEERG